MPGGLEKLHGLSPFLAWCLSSSLLISLSHSVFFHPLLPYLPLSLFTHHLSSVLPSLLCLYQSLDVIAALLPSSPRSPATYPYFYFFHPLSSFLAMPLLRLSVSERVALTIQLALPMWLTLDQHDWARPPWVLPAGQFSEKKKCLKKGPPLILKIYYR